MKDNIKLILGIIGTVLLIILLSNTSLFETGSTVVFDPNEQDLETGEFSFGLTYSNTGNLISTADIGDERTAIKPIYVCDDNYDENEFKPECYRYIFNHSRAGTPIGMDEENYYLLTHRFDTKYVMNKYLSYECHKNRAYIEDDLGGWDPDEEYTLSCRYYISPDFIDISADNSFMPDKGYFELNQDAEIKIIVDNDMFGFNDAGYITDYYIKSGLQRDIPAKLNQKSLRRGINIFTVPLKTDEESLTETDITLYVEIENQRFRLNKKLSFNYITGENIYESHKDFIEYPEIIKIDYNDSQDGQDDDIDDKVCSDFIYSLPGWFGQENDCDSGTNYLIIGIIAIIAVLLLLKKKK